MASSPSLDVQSKAVMPFTPNISFGSCTFDYDSGSSTSFPRKIRFVLGGDPAAGSPTATLLRLNPPYKAQVRNGQHSTIPHPNLIRVVRRAVCARSRDVFTAR
jgi:hypothetical protein